MGIIRKTQSITILLNEFADDTVAIAATELAKRLKTQLNKTTIYRLLSKLEDDGIVHSFLDRNGTKWYAKCTGCTTAKHADIHPHFQCTDCGKVDCLSIEIPIPNIPNRKVTISQMLLQGKCEHCLAQSSD